MCWQWKQIEHFDDISNMMGVLKETGIASLLRASAFTHWFLVRSVLVAFVEEQGRHRIWRHRKLHNRKWRHRKSWTGNGNESEIISRAFFLYPYFPCFSGTPLDSRYEQCFELKNNQSYAFDLNPTNGDVLLTNWLSAKCMLLMIIYDCIFYICSLFICLFVCFFFRK